MFKTPAALKFFLGLLLLILTYGTNAPSTHAQVTCANNNLNTGGLISGLNYTAGSATFGNQDTTCVIDTQAVYREFKVPTYTDLEDQFYTLSRSTAKRSAPLGSTIPPFSTDGIYLQTTDMTISGPITGTGVQVIFIRGNLAINTNIDYADTDPYSGLVFVVSGNINISSTVTKVNAVLISSGTICTAFTTVCLDGSGSNYTSQLTINGSLISINKNNLDVGTPAITLGRNLLNNIAAAEVINKQSKYLYILRNGIFTRDLILTEEDKSYAITANPGPPPPPPPPPAPVCPGATDPLSIPTAPAAQAWKAISDCVLSIYNAGT